MRAACFQYKVKLCMGDSRKRAERPWIKSCLADMIAFPCPDILWEISCPFPCRMSASVGQGLKEWPQSIARAPFVANHLFMHEWVPGSLTAWQPFAGHLKGNLGNHFKAFLGSKHEPSKNQRPYRSHFIIADRIESRS